MIKRLLGVIAGALCGLPPALAAVTTAEPPASQPASYVDRRVVEETHRGRQRQAQPRPIIRRLAQVVAQDDNLVRVRNGLEVRHLTGLTIAQPEIELSVYGFADYFPDAPRPPVAGTRTSRFQVEPGFLLGAAPQWRIHNVELPRLGIGYRFAGDLSGRHLDISTPF